MPMAREKPGGGGFHPPSSAEMDSSDHSKDTHSYTDFDVNRASSP